ncbi:unnamed protein product [Bemisia tabaci]|uniref:AAA-ATPase-like domain-containing protein n=1 Tax=Bemisia tabaci TaxID=7038 RepID=A0A9P0AGB6_BEMTA|nr:unnamed protein product [Bemisia tabaci]
MLRLLFFTYLIFQTYGFLVYPQDDSSPSDEESSPSPHLRPLLLADHYHDGWQHPGIVYNIDDSFCKVRDKPTFIDRTRFIKHFYERKEPMAIHAPPRFGKTSNLEMLKLFFDIPVDLNGTPVQNYVEQKRAFFDNLLTCRDMDSFFCMDYIASHPVIFLDFMSLDTENIESFNFTLRIMMRVLFENHGYLANSPLLSREEHGIFNKDVHPSLKEDVGAIGGLILARLLHKHHNRSCIVLIDNYDAPVAKMIVKGNKDDSMSQIFKTLTDLMKGLFKDNTFVSHFLLTGISSIGSVYTQEVKNLSHYSIFENATLSNFYGLKFKDDEDFIMGRFGKPEWVDEARRPYGGYHSLATNEKMLALRSFSKFMEEEGKYDDFERIPILLQLEELLEYDKFGRVIEKTLETNTTIVNKRPPFSEQDIKNLHDLISRQKNEPDEATQVEHLMLQFLQENGVYTIISKDDTTHKVDIVVPNLEIKKLLQYLLYTENFFVEKYQLTREKMGHFVDSVIKLNDKRESFQTMISAIRSLFEKVIPETESEFRAPLYSLPRLMGYQSFWRVDNEVLGPNKTIIDTLLFRKDKTLIIFEFKFERDSASAALLDVVNKKKCEDETDEKPLNTILVGLHFSSRRDCSVSYLYNKNNAEEAITIEEKMR